jgi:hypothetical protein
MKKLILLGLLAGMLPAQDPDVSGNINPRYAEQLLKEVTKLKKELADLREINRLKAEVEKAKRLLAEEKLSPRERAKLAAKRAKEAAKQKKRQPKPKPKPAPKGWVFRPPRLPAIEVGTIVVLQDKDGSWWFVSRRHDRGLLTLNDFGKGRSGKNAAETWAASERIRLNR